MNKKELRKKYKELRQFLSTEEIEDKSMAIANKLLELVINCCAWTFGTNFIIIYS